MKKTTCLRFLMYYFTLFLFFGGVGFGGETESLPNEVRWVRKSEEYPMLCQQVFKQAREVIGKAMKGNKGVANLAVVVDLDETILDNSLYQVERWKAGLSFTQESWSIWVNRKEAGLVPGAQEFLKGVRKKGVRIVFLSNRMASNLEPTKENLKILDVLDSKDLFLLRLDKSDTKGVRRAEVLEGTGRMKKIGSLRVIGYVGDQVGDFPADPLNALSKTNFLLPNPMYGKW